MAAHPSRRALALLTVPLSSSVGGGLTKVGHGGDLTTIIVALGPAAICAATLCCGMCLYRADQRRYLAADPKNRQAIREHNAQWVNMVVSALTLTRIQTADGVAAHPGRRSRSPVPAQRAPSCQNCKKAGREASGTAGRRAVPTGRPGAGRWPGTTGAG